MSPWEVMRPKLKELGYSDEQIDEMTLVTTVLTMTAEYIASHLTLTMLIV
jgi:hypothetical protein